MAIVKMSLGQTYTLLLNGAGDDKGTVHVVPKEAKEVIIQAKSDSFVGTWYARGSLFDDTDDVYSVLASGTGEGSWSVPAMDFIVGDSPSGEHTSGNIDIRIKCV